MSKLIVLQIAYLSINLKHISIQCPISWVDSTSAEG